MQCFHTQSQLVTLASLVKMLTLLPTMLIAEYQKNNRFTEIAIIIIILYINTGTVFVCVSVCLSVCLSVPCEISGMEGHIAALLTPT